MTMLRNKYSQLLAAGIKKIFVDFNELAMKESMMEDIFTIENSKQAYEDEIVFAGLGPMPEKVENDSFQYGELVQGGSKRVIHLTYGLGSRYSWELSEDDQYGIIKQVPKAIARSGNFTRQMVPFNILNQGFTSVKTVDGETLFNNAHPLLGGSAATATGPGVSNVVSTAGTYPNRPPVDVDLSYTALQLMNNHFERFVDSMGLPATMKPKLLAIPTELQFIAEEILGSDLTAYTADNTKNSIKRIGLSFKVYPYFTSSSAWYVFADKSQTQLKFYNRAPLQQDMDDDFDTRSVKHVAFQRFSAAAINWLGTWASAGP